MSDFVGLQKIARYSRKVIVTEKIDGTNAQIFIGDDGEFLTGSRTRWITPDKDNHGFSRWAHDHKDELMQLGLGRHFGEWWGSGIQRGYGLSKGEKRFSLFNVTRWCLYGSEPKEILTGDPRISEMQQVLPECIGLVPILFECNMDDLNVSQVMAMLAEHGSYAAPCFMKPEGIVIYHTAGNFMMKKTFEKDEKGKWEV